MREWLIERRKEKIMTQKQVADLIGINRAYYTQIELGYRGISLPMARRMSVNLNIPWQVFFENE